MKLLQYRLYFPYYFGILTQVLTLRKHKLCRPYRPLEFCLHYPGRKAWVTWIVKDIES